MASISRPFSSLPVFLLLVIFFFSSSPPSTAEVTTSTTIQSDSICKSTPHPSFCTSVLLNNHSGGNIYDYGKISVRRSLSAASKFLGLVNWYLGRQSSLSLSAIRALEDCKLLAELNIDFLSSSAKTVNTSTTTTLPKSETEDVHALLSAILTNQQTCLDGLQSTASAWNVKNGLYTPLTNGTKLYSLSLALFTRGWVHHQKEKPNHKTEKKQRRKLLFSSMRMSRRNQEIYENVSGRRLLQTSMGGDAVVVRDMVVVAKDGSGNFTTINDAVAAAPNNTNINDGYFLIYVVAGVYEEYVSIDKNKLNILMIGDGINHTIITGNRSVADGWTTFNSATFAVVGQGFIGVNMTIRNTAGAIKYQAVALRNGADLSTFYSCSFEGYQDTLYTHSLRQFYRECNIYGTVDFIFGNAAVVFQKCNLYARQPIQGQFNALTAQGRTDPNQNTGTSIQGCNILAAPDLISSNFCTKTYLGRPWKAYSRTVYMQSFMDSLIDPSGWAQWNGSFALSTLYYAEFNNTGPGSNTTNRVTWSGYHVINSTVAANFTVSNFILGDNWLPPTEVPHTGALL
ncbi:pectinesterase-like [Telopea speciosissima]|uniref:pectinesterase-like n=1 Tax=Telopea speciosissima TaxID=54955 RepID=UPI001CC35FAC|nr:pectinesterase-like [Telopea speciosissima]